MKAKELSKEPYPGFDSKPEEVVYKSNKYMYTKIYTLRNCYTICPNKLVAVRTKEHDYIYKLRSSIVR